jgi:hypothetical protein
VVIVIFQQMFYLQVKEAVLNDEVYCSPEASVLLASYIMQAKYGDYNPAEKARFTKDKLLPQRYELVFLFQAQTLYELILARIIIYAKTGVV